MTRRSIGTSTIPGIPWQRSDVPKRYRCPCSRIISPKYITVVIADADSAGTVTDSAGLFPNKNAPRGAFFTEAALRGGILSISDLSSFPVPSAAAGFFSPPAQEKPAAETHRAFHQNAARRQRPRANDRYCGFCRMAKESTAATACSSASGSLS